MSHQKKICYVVNNTAFFVSHRLPIALKALQLGYEIYLVVGLAGSPVLEPKAIETISKYPIKFTQIKFKGSGINPFREIVAVIRLYKHLKRINPDIIHCVSPKGVAYGGVVSRFLKQNKLILAISGMGYIYAYDSTQHLKKQLLSVLYEFFLKFVIKHKNKKIIVQNHDDYNRFLKYKNVNENELKLIRGSGVDLSLYQDLDMSLKEKIVLFPARVLIDKGAVEFYEASTLLKERFSQWRFVMAGVLDYSNPTMIKKSVLEAWRKSGNIELIGHIESIHSLYEKASIVCLPSYGEGLPKSILEASAAGCAVVTTDVVGCRDAVINGVTGILVRVKDAKALADALLKLIENSDLRKSYGVAGALYAKNNFGISGVIDSTLTLYEDKK